MRFLFLLALGLAAWPAADAQSARRGYSTFLGSYLNRQAMTLDGSLFAAKLHPAGSAYEYLTYFGSTYDAAADIAVDAAGNTYVTGTASSPSFPVTGTGYFGYAPNGSGPVGFVTKLDPHCVFSASRAT